jgi:hypothetical protein
MKTNCSTKINKLVLSIISVCVFIDFFEKYCYIYGRILCVLCVDTVVVKGKGGRK